MSHLHQDCETCCVPAVKVEAQPVERRQNKGQPATLMCCGCCCCCCCCLHSVGGLIGAAVGSKTGFDPDRGEYGEAVPSAARFYWPIFGACAVLSVLIGTWYYGTGRSSYFHGPRPEDFLIGGFFLLLGLPLVQLAASVISLLVVVCVAHPEDRGDYLWSLGKITLSSVVGAVAGIAVMAALCVPFMMR